MAYDVTLVEVISPGGIGGVVATNTLSGMGFPTTPFNFLLMSIWCCLPKNGGDFAGCDFSAVLPFGSLAGAPSSFLSFITFIPSFAGFFNADYQTASPNERSNILLSINCLTQTVQYYVNDAPVSPTSGAGWTANDSFGGEDIFAIWALDTGSVLTDYPAVADWYVEAPTQFFDLSIEANRRKFINSDLTPVDLGSDGSLPTGHKPAIFLTVPFGGTPNSFLTNRGRGTSFHLNSGISLGFQTPGTCHLPLTAALTGVSATAQVGSLSFPTSTWAITSNVQTPSPGAVGDVWANNSYIDFSDPSVRANFENADGSWLNLGYNGATPTGSSPLLYLTVQLQQPPSDILTGYGQGGAQTHWALLDQGTNPSTGQAYPAMSFDACVPPSGNLELTDIEVIATSPTIPDNEVTLRWSDDAGASWSNGLLRSLGQAGEYFTAPTWYRLGMSRNRILELSWSGARAEALQGVFVEVTISAT